MPIYSSVPYPYTNIVKTDIRVDNEIYDVIIDEIEIVRNEIHISTTIFDKLNNSQRHLDKVIML